MYVTAPDALASSSTRQMDVEGGYIRVDGRSISSHRVKHYSAPVVKELRKRVRLQEACNQDACTDRVAPHSLSCRIPRVWARRTASMRDVAPSFWKMLCTWRRTVPTAIDSSSAMA